MLEPQVGVHVERIRDRHALTDDGAQPGRALGRERREIQRKVSGHVRGHRHVTARRAHHDSPAPGQRSTGVEDLQRLAQRRQRLATGNSSLRAIGVEHGIAARKCARVAAGGADGGFGATGLDHRDRLAVRPCLVDGAREPCGVLDALEVQAEGRDRGSSLSTSIRSAAARRVWLPTVSRYPIGSERSLNINVSAMVPLWEISATPRSGDAPTTWSGHSATRSKKLTMP